MTFESGEHRFQWTETISKTDFQKVNTPVSNELVVKRNELTKGHFSEERR